VARNQSPDGQISSDACSVTGRTNVTRAVTTYLEQASSRFPNTHVLNLNDLVCPDDICRAFSRDGLVVFRDGRHLTDSFVLAQVPVILARVEQY
jgi:hypothetical protein